jgi:hypothetical protein
MTISQQFRDWFDDDPLQSNWNEGKKLRAAFNAGWHNGHNEGKVEGILSEDAKTAYKAGLNAQLSSRPLTHRSATKVLSGLYHYLTIVDSEDGRKSSYRTSIAEAINRVKMNYHLLQFLQERGLVAEFKLWYFASKSETKP